MEKEILKTTIPRLAGREPTGSEPLSSAAAHSGQLLHPIKLGARHHGGVARGP